jgi:hypothetical protein
MAERINEDLARRAKIVERPLPEKDALLQELLSPKDEAMAKRSLESYQPSVLRNPPFGLVRIEIVSDMMCRFRPCNNSRIDWSVPRGTKIDPHSLGLPLGPIMAFFTGGRSVDACQ